MKSPLFLLLLFTLQLTFAQGHTLTVRVTGMQGSGILHVQLFEEGQKFRADSPECRKEKVHIRDGHGLVCFSGVHDGKYAIMLYHDENENGILDTNMLGMPKEGVGTSNNTKGIPSFKKCQFPIVDSMSIDIELVYL